jgi:hypothetical protein
MRWCWLSWVAVIYDEIEEEKGGQGSEPPLRVQVRGAAGDAGSARAAALPQQVPG